MCNVFQKVYTGLPEPWDGLSAAYQEWRNNRLQQLRDQQKHGPDPFFHTVSQDMAPKTLTSICESIRLDGFALYQWTSAPANPAQMTTELNRALNLHQSDTGVVTRASSLSLLQDMKGTAQGRFIPYSNRAMNWHTDGYYNSDDEIVRCFSLYCIQPAAEGGALSLMDTELLLIALYDKDQQLVTTLAHPEAMMLPANADQEGHDRPDRHVPVIFMHDDGTPGFRFTARTTHIHWLTPATKEAAQQALELISKNENMHTTITLQPQQGLITRNILHRRQAFSDNPSGAQRQILRGRFTQLPDVQISPQSRTGFDNDAVR